MNRRGIELQFNWIFILIAGAVILAFFFSVVQKQRALSEEKLSITLATQMDAIFTGAIESKGTTQILATPQPGIAFACTNVCDCFYRIGTKSTEFRDKLLFAPAFIKDEDARAWSVEWKLPFRVANFLLLTNPRVIYYLVYDAGDQLSAQLYQRISKALPKEINMQAFSSLGAVSQLSPQGYAHTRFVFLGIDPVNPSTLGLSRAFADQEVSAVKIDPDLSSAIVYEKSDPEELSFNSYQTLLAGDATAYAAIFAADHQMYNCMMQRAFKELGVVADVSARRALALDSALSARPECALYQPAHDVLNEVVQKAGLLSTQFPQAEEALSTIKAVQPELQRQNNNLILQSCPELY